jgi:hypothetical protein
MFNKPFLSYLTNIKTGMGNMGIEKGDLGDEEGEHKESVIWGRIMRNRNVRMGREGNMRERERNMKFRSSEEEGEHEGAEYGDGECYVSMACSAQRELRLGCG